MILFAFFGSLMLAGIVAYLFERWGWTHNGLVPSILIAFGAVVVLYFVRALFGIGFASPGVNAIVGSAAALILIPTEWANRRRSKRRR